MAPCVRTAVGPVGKAAAQGERTLAQRIVRTRRRRQARVGVAARPRLDAGIEIKRALLLTELDQRHARYVDRDVEQKIAGAEPSVEHIAVVVAAERGNDEVDAVLGGDIAAVRLGGDDRDLVGADIEMAKQQRQDALADAAKADDQETAGKGSVLFIEHDGLRGDQGAANP